MSYPPFYSDKGLGGASGFEALGGVEEGIGRFQSIIDKDPFNIEHEDCFRGRCTGRGRGWVCAPIGCGRGPEVGPDLDG